MTLPQNFQFSQSSLQDYVDCARRFELRYIEHRKWPAVEAEPIIEHERHMQQGAIFHHLIHQHQLGIPAEILTRSANEDPLNRWWAAYLNDRLVASLPDQRYPETVLSGPLGKGRITAKYDLLAIQPGERAIIIDWKTSKHKPKRSQLAERLQTIIYRYLLAEAGADLNGGAPIPPEQIEMVYWFAEDPANPERFAYSTAQHNDTHERLASLTNEINARKDFDLTTDTHRCKFCTYRSLCDRGVKAGNLEDMTESTSIDEPGDMLDFDLDFDQIAEIEF